MTGSNFQSLARWPLLLAACILFGVAMWEASHETDPNRPVGIVSMCLACVLLGAWVYSLAMEAERRWHTQRDTPTQVLDASTPTLTLGHTTADGSDTEAR